MEFRIRRVEHPRFLVLVQVVDPHPPLREVVPAVLVSLGELTTMMVVVVVVLEVQVVPVELAVELAVKLVMVE